MIDQITLKYRENKIGLSNISISLNELILLIIEFI